MGCGSTSTVRLTVTYETRNKYSVSAIIYLDGHASTPLAPEALTAMAQAWQEAGNPSSPHAAGARSLAIVEDARSALASLIGSMPSELIFTSGATEANNLAIIGCARAARGRNDGRNRIVVSAIEHKSVLATALALRGEGFAVEIAPVDHQGRIDLRVLAELVDGETLLVSIGAANGEIGTLQPMAEIVCLARRAGALVHSDLAQMAGKVPVSVSDLDLDYASLSGHKMYGPVGIGALFASSMAPQLVPIAHGGGQERGLRPGTLAAPLAAGFGEAARLCARHLRRDADHANALAEKLLIKLDAQGIYFIVNGDKYNRLPGSLSLNINGVNSDSLVDRISHKLAISTGSACQSGEVQPSHILKAIGLSDSEQRSTIRLCIGRYNSADDIQAAAALLVDGIEKERLAAGGILQ